MFCSKCGAKLKEDDEFCPKCGEVRPERKNGKEVTKPIPAATNPSGANCSKSCALTVLILFFLGFLSTLFIYFDKIKATPGLKIAFYFLGAFFVVIFFSYLFRKRKKMSGGTRDTDNVQDKIKPHQNRILNAISVLITIAVIAGMAFGVYYFFKNIKINPNTEDTATNKTKTTNNDNIKTTASWDGYYDSTMQKPNCDSTVELTAFQVLGNKVINLYGSDAAIGSDGRASMLMSYGPMTVNFNFSSSSGRNTMSGTWSSRGCSGTFSGQRTYSF